MIVYFLRHASAGQSKSDPEKDNKRALDKDGIEQCRLVGSALAALDTQVDAILSSPLKRATQTAALVGSEFGHDGKVQVEAALAPGSSFADFRAMLRKYDRHEAVMVVGHNPSLSEFLSLTVSNRHGNAAFDLKKGAVAKVDWRNRSAVLEWLLTPKIARALYEAAPQTRSAPSARG